MEKNHFLKNKTYKTNIVGNMFERRLFLYQYLGAKR